MKDQLVYSQQGKLFLNTTMSQSAFSKSRLQEKISEKGTLAVKTDSGWNFEPWYFDNSRLSEIDENSTLSEEAKERKRTIILEGKAFEGCTLKNYFDQDYSKHLDEEEKAYVICAAALTCSALEESVNQKYNINCCGGGGIFIASDFSKIIFLPYGLFLSSVSCNSDDISSEYSGIYLNPSLKNESFVHFTQCVIAYRALTGNFPYNKLKKSFRHEDYIDGNFTPISKSVWALNKELADFIDSSLKRKPQLSSDRRVRSVTDTTARVNSILEGTKSGNVNLTKAAFPLEIFYNELGLTDDGKIPESKKLNSVIRTSDVSPDEFEASSRKYTEGFDRKLKFKRWARHNRTRIIAVTCCTACAIGITLSFVKSNRSQPTTISLNSMETVEMFYSAFNNLENTAALRCLESSKVSQIPNMINNVYVASKSRSVYDKKEETVPLSQWLYFNYDCSYNIFGLSQFMINTQKGSLYREGPAKNTNPKPLAEEFDSPIRKGETKVYKTSYYFIFNEDKENLGIEEYEDKVELTFKKNRWVISKFTSQQLGTTVVNLNAFKQDYLNAMEHNEKDVLSASEELTEKYPWMSMGSEIMEGKDAFLEDQILF